MKMLLLEIGAEEIPAGYIAPALKALETSLLKKLSQARIDHGAAKTFGTPRRLTISVADVAEKQAEITTEAMGPPEKIAFDDTGAPTVAARKFAEKLGVKIEDLTVKETAKGRYLSAVTTDAGEPTPTFLARVFPEIIQGIPFPKTMKWADQDVFFARPIHSLVALFGTDVIAFSLAGVQSGATTHGHSIMSPDEIELTDPEAYIETLRKVNVLADIAERREKVAAGVKTAAESVGGLIVPDEALVDIVTNLVEYPVPVVGNFDPAYLEIPREILITAMREHQKYFAVTDAAGKLRPHFIALNNTRTKDASLAAKGHERVLRARLEDAGFFYKTDRAVSMETWVDRLKNVLFQAKLGSIYEKVKRIESMAGFLANQLTDNADLKAHAGRAAHLCKADLVSQMVGEFPKLQGIMGRVYATESGEPEPVATAIEEHYQPTYSGGTLPKSKTGALVAIADKMDSICGCFSVGLIPTGAADPYALRRQSIGIIQIMLDNGFDISLKHLIETNVALFEDTAQIPAEETIGKVLDFFQGRIMNLLVEDGFSKDVVAAITAVSVENIPNVWDRVRALEKLKAETDFEPLAIAFKRVVNIIKKAETDGDGTVDEGLFEDPCENNLYREYQNTREKVVQNIANGQYDQALKEIAGLRGAVDDFFDGVMVMAEDENIRTNRLSLLGRIAGLFALIADFSRIST